MPRPHPEHGRTISDRNRTDSIAGHHLSRFRHSVRQAFNTDTICDKSPALVESYERLFAAALINLAISIRVSLSREPEYLSLTSGVQASGLFETGAHRTGQAFSVKDVCDKIIHADEIFKPSEVGVCGAGCRLRGSHHGAPWEFGLGVSIFCEFVLAWLDRIEKKI
jgi:hypothetical protein